MFKWPEATIWDGVADVADRWPTSPALLFDGETMTYADLRETSRAFAHGLAARGVGDGDFIGVWLGTRPAVLQTVLAASYLGAAVVPINARYRSHEVEYMLADGECSVVVIEGDLLGENYLDLLVEVVGAFNPADRGGDDPLPSLEHVLTVGNASDHAGATSFDAVVEDGRGAPRIDPADDPTAPVAVFYTSGTTGDPKGCLQSNRSLLNHSHRIGERLGVDEDDVGFTALPVYGIWGFNSLLSSICHGMSVVVQTRFDPAEALAAIDDNDVTYCSILAIQLFRMADLGTFEPEMFDSFRRATVAFTSSTFTEARFRKIEEMFGFPPVRAYGLSEGNSQVFLGDPEAPFDERRKLGGPICHPDERAKIVDPETGEERPRGESGEILLKGFNVMSGYLGRPDATADAMTDGWFYTGDLGRQVGDDEFVYESRLDDALRTRGFLVLPEQIESVIDDYPGVVQSQVVGVPHHRHGEVPVAFVTLDDPNVIETDIRAHLEEHIADYKVPEAIQVVDAFPRSNGPHGEKVKKAELRERADDLIAK